MKVVAFLQNIWVRDPEQAKAAIAKYGEKYRRRLIKYALFAGCLTGRRLKKAFGEEWCQEIIWEEASREIHGDPKTTVKADAEHIRQVLSAERPDLVICFTSVGRKILQDECVERRIFLINTVHPAMRGAKVIDHLEQARRALEMINAGKMEELMSEEIGSRTEMLLSE